jgi:hypothetical protein
MANEVLVTSMQGIVSIPLFLRTSG